MIVQPAFPCTSKLNLKYILALKERYPFLEVFPIGKSYRGEDILCIKIGSGSESVFYNGAHHSTEWITSLLLLRFVEECCIETSTGMRALDYEIAPILENRSIYIVPMVNPDGVNLSINGPNLQSPYYRRLMEINPGGDFSNWNANFRGVDLNHNYNAMWEEGKALEKSYAILGPGPTRYGGEYPESESESSAVAEFCRNMDFRLSIAFHSQGEVIYWKFNGNYPKKSSTIVEIMACASGYTPDETEGIASYRGFKDWFISEFNRPSFTVEVGLGKNPLPLSQFHKIYADIAPIMVLGAVIY